MSFPLFSAFGVEIEYMIVDAKSLNVSPTTDRLLGAVAGEIVSEIELGDIAWSNELALHVLELKTNGPATDLTRLPQLFSEQVQRANTELAAWDARLMPTAMHPWMDPHRELQLWPHEYNAVYEAYNRIFNCQGHGWANLQSVHLNLPFQGDLEFARLHAAIRLLLPLLPALAASSPFADGRNAGMLDYRLQVYRGNSRIIPSLTGEVIPEPVYSHAEYESQIFQRLYRDIAPHDPDGILQQPFLNSRGAIARFDRGAIEIRVVDAQECPTADLAIVAFEVATLQALVNEQWTGWDEQSQIDTAQLSSMLFDVARDGEQTVIANADYLRQWGIAEKRCSAQELCQHLVRELRLDETVWAGPLKVLTTQGPLARRLLKAVGDDVPNGLFPVYAELCDCLAANRQFGV
ncbi:MAG: hypothetical protein KDA90_04750 [Planctomycetaceae bacterium]|nr:hypothetical protein [Planctomycetaceae bacterium]